MSLKQLIKEKKLLASGAIDLKFELPGEPLIYSIKYLIGDRKRSVQFFRDEKWRSILKCVFRSYFQTKIPVVVIVWFYVTPSESVKISPKALRSETTPAVFAFELCDYLLSFKEMLFHVLINSYKQVVYVEAYKFYSDNPRTVFQFMKWDHYVELNKNKNSLLSEAQKSLADRPLLNIQSKRERNESNKKLRDKRNSEKKSMVG